MAGGGGPIKDGDINAGDMGDIREAGWWGACGGGKRLTSGDGLGCGCVGRGGGVAFVRDGVGGAAHDGAVGGDVFEDGGTCANDRIAADDEVGEDGGAGADEGAVADGDAAGEGGARCDVDAISQVAVMIDDGAGVDNAQFAEPGVGADDGAGHDDGAIAELRGGGDIGVGMDEDGEAQADGAGVIGEASAGGVVADGDDGAMDAVDADEAAEFFGGSEDQDAVDLGAVELGIIVHESSKGANAGAFHELEENAGLSAGAVNNHCHESPALP